MIADNTPRQHPTPHTPGNRQAPNQTCAYDVPMRRRTTPASHDQLKCACNVHKTPAQYGARNVHQHDPVHNTYVQGAHPSPSAGTRRQSCAYNVHEASLIVCMARTSTRSCAYDVRETSQTRPPIYVPCTRSENRIRVMHTMPPSHVSPAINASADFSGVGHWERDWSQGAGAPCDHHARNAAISRFSYPGHRERGAPRDQTRSP